MSRPPRPSHLPLRDGVSASCVVVRPGDAPTALDFLAARLPVLSRDEWAERLARGEVLDAQGQPRRVVQAYSWAYPLSAHGLMHTVIRNA